MPTPNKRGLAIGAVVALASAGLTVLPSSPATAADEPSQILTSGAELDSRVIFQDFSFYQPYESDTYTTIASRASELADLGVTDVWMAPPYRALDAYNEEGYAVTDRYDLGEFPAGHNGETATKYGTSDELKSAIAALHAEGVNVQADIVPNQTYLYQDREVVPVTAVDQYGNPNRSDVVNKLYEVYTVGGGAGAQTYGEIKTWKSANLNGIGPQELGTDRVMLDADGTPYRYLGGDATANGNYVPAGAMRTAANINNIDGYLTVDGYFIAGQTAAGNDIWRSNLLWYVESQQGAITSKYLDYVRANPPVGSGITAADTDSEVRTRLIYATTDAAAANTTNDYIGAQPGYSSASESGITALQFGDGTGSNANKNTLQYEYLIGPDVDNSDATVQSEQTNWEEFLLDEYDFDGFRWDAAGHYNKEVLQNAGELMRTRAEAAGTDPVDNLNFIESYVPEQVPFLNENGNPQLAYDTRTFYAYQAALGDSNPVRWLTDVVTESFVDRTGDSSETAIPNWSFVNNHDTEHNDMAVIPVTDEETGGAPYGTKAYQLAQYKKYTADRKRSVKQWAPHNIPASYALTLTNKDTVPSVFYGDMWEAADSYMTTKSPYYDAISDLLKVRKTNVSGEQVVSYYPSNLSGNAGEDLISSVREGTDRESGIGVVVGNDSRLSTSIEVPMGAAHADQEYVDALGFHDETLTTDEDGMLTVDVDGVRNVQVNGYLAAWVPKSADTTDPTDPTDPGEPPVDPTDPDPTGPIASSTRLLVSDRRIAYGQSSTLVAAVPVGATGTVTFTSAGRTLATAVVEDGTVATPTPTNLAVGRHRIVARYSGDASTSPSRSTAGSLVVARAGTTARVVRARTVAGSTRIAWQLAALANGEAVTGKVRVLVAGKGVRTVTLRAKDAGVRALVLARTFPASARVKVRFLGSAKVRAATSKAVRITRR